MFEASVRGKGTAVPESACDICREDQSFLREYALRFGTTFSVRAVDLFAGCGGISYGLSIAAGRLGGALQVELAVDTDAVALATLAANIPGSTIKLSRVEDLFDGVLGERLTPTEKQWQERVAEPDILVGGPPCQGYSDLNNRTRRNDPRNQLYLRMARAAEVLRPKFVLIENVTAVRLDPSGVVAHACTALERSGYVVDRRLVDMSLLGVPQTRRRFVILAARADQADLLDTTADLGPRCALHLPRSVGWAIGDLLDRPQVGFDAPSRMSRTNETRAEWLFSNERHDLPNELRPPCHQGTHRYASMYGRLHWDRPAQTVTTGYGSMGQGRNVHPLEQRLITPHEAARLQTFPDSFDFGQAQRTEWAKMIGNAVPPLVNMTIGMRLIPALREPSEITRLAAAVR